MLELADRLLPLLRRGVPVAAATSIDVLGSAPHLAGTSMAVTPDGGVIGSVSGGCVEASALHECRALLADGATRVRRFGFGDAAAARAGLACGGELDVLVHPLGGAAVEEELERVLAGLPAALGVIVSGPEPLLGRTVTAGSAHELDGVAGLSSARLRAVLEGARVSGSSGFVEVACDPLPIRIFVDVAAPARRMLIGGATETATALAAAASALGFVVTVCDPRGDFARPERFPAADLVVHGFVHDVLAAASLGARDVVCLLSHDEDLDPLALAVALESDAGYVGALGSRSTAARRRAALAALGVAPASVDRLRSPIGLDLGARTPAEVAVSIVAEVLAAQHGGDATPLRTGTGPIHRALPVA